MIAYLRGKVIARSEYIFTILPDAGVGFEVEVARLTQDYEVDQEISLYIYHHQREDVSSLYGFETSNDREAFKILLSVNGIGPKIALSLIRDLGVDVVAGAVAEGNEKILTSVSGLGSKGAARIILELKGKLDKLASERVDDVFLLARDALVSMGVKQSEAMAKLKKLSKNSYDSLESLIVDALKN